MFVSLLTRSNPKQSLLLSDIRPPQELMTDENYLQANLKQVSPEVQQIVTQVLQLEKKKLYQKFPRHINEEILTIIKDVVQ